MDRPTCRLCLSWDVWCKPLPIFSSGHKEFGNLQQIIYDCSGIKVCADDGGPGVICHRCLGNITIFNEFREKCRKNNEFLMKFGSLAPEKNAARDSCIKAVEATPSGSSVGSEALNISCVQCSKVFDTVSTLRAHVMLRHTGNSVAQTIEPVHTAVQAEYENINRASIQTIAQADVAEIHKAVTVTADQESKENRRDDLIATVQSNENYQGCNRGSFFQATLSPHQQNKDAAPLPSLDNNTVNATDVSHRKDEKKIQREKKIRDYIFYTEVRPFPCSQCGHTFSTELKRKAHCNCHKQFENSTYTCSLCLKDFFSLQSHNKHKQIVHRLALTRGRGRPSSSKQLTKRISRPEGNISGEDKLIQSNKCATAVLQNNPQCQKPTENVSLNTLNLNSVLSNDSTASNNGSCLNDSNSLMESSITLNHVSQTSTLKVPQHNSRLILKNSKLAECQICHKVLQKTYISLHLKRHLGIKKYKCNSACGAAFVTPPELKYHAVKCEFRKPQMMPKKKQIDSLQLKQNDSLIEKHCVLFECNMCSKKYVSEKFLNDHKIITH